MLKLRVDIQSTKINSFNILKKNKSKTKTTAAGLEPAQAEPM